MITLYKICFIFVGSLSYAYFTAIGEVTPMDAILNTASVSVKFSDNDLGVNKFIIILFSYRYS